MSFREFAALRARFAEREKREDERFGVLAATVANCAFGQTRQFSPEDFFASLKPEQPQRMSGNQMEDWIRAFREARKRK